MINRSNLRTDIEEGIACSGHADQYKMGMALNEVPLALL